MNDKGQFKGSCNITSCQKPNSANWFNHSTLKFYCESCANRLNNDEFNKSAAMRIFGHELCTNVKIELEINGEIYPGHEYSSLYDAHATSIFLKANGDQIRVLVNGKEIELAIDLTEPKEWYESLLKSFLTE